MHYLRAISYMIIGYRSHLVQYLDSRIAETSTLPGRESHYKIFIDGVWDRKELRDFRKCRETCRKIMLILGKCTEKKQSARKF